jgi:hypothetical protein
VSLLPDADGDIAIVNGRWTFARGVTAIEQGIQARLGVLLGEWFLDESVGVPYYQSVLVKNPNETLIREVIRRALAATPGVTRVDSIALAIDSAARHARIDWRVSTTAGVIENSTEVI